MSITPEAIKHIGKMSHVPEFLEQLAKADTKSQLILVPDGFQVNDLEGHQENRNSLRGNFKTPVIAEFVKYGSKFIGDAAKTFIDVESMSARTIFDLGDTAKAGHQRHKATLQLRKTAPFKILLGRDGRAAHQREMAEWLEDNTEFLQAFDGNGEVIEMSRAIAAVRELSFEHKRGRESNVQNFAESQSEYESIATKTREDLVLPHVFVFTCIPYQGLESFRFELRVSIKGADTINLRIKNLEAMEEKIAQHFLELLQKTFEDEEIEQPLFIGEWN
ncbi:TPA: DUF2303 family protein [Vibrio harveyi]|nr:DUF2303 family protein [Vibrio harveyi]